jgi:spore photoproduct lyase
MVALKGKKDRQDNHKSSRLKSENWKGRFLRKFDRTPSPNRNTDVVCPHFMMLAWANGCPFNCAWCYLKGTFRFYRQKPDGRVPIILKDRNRMEKEIQIFLERKGSLSILINAGELSDSLMDEARQVPFSGWIMNLFRGTMHKVLFLTKSTNIRNFLRNDWQDQAVLSWSINAVAVAERWEKLAPTVADRLDAAKQVYDAGYEVRLRIDPMVPVPEWKTCYAKLVEMIYSRLKPSRVTLGCLRGLNSTILYCRDKSWTAYLAEKSNWGKKPQFQQRLEMYQFVIGQLKARGLKDYSVCKDSLEIWKTLGLNPAEIRCNCVM